MNRILVAGIGNIFLGDDAFGVEVVQRLGTRALPDGIEVADFGIRALDLCYALQDGYAAAILVDAVPRGGAPGSLYVIEPDAADGAPRGDAAAAASPHDLDPVAVLRMARDSGDGRCAHVLIVGCEPHSFGTEDDGEGRIGLAPAVAASVDRACELVEALASRLQRSPDAAPHGG